MRKNLNDYHCRISRALEGDLDDPVVSAVLESRRAGGLLDTGTCLVDASVKVSTVLESLPGRGGAVELRDDEVRWSWVWVLHELQMALSVRLGEKRHSDAAGKLMTWLRQMVDEVVGLSELPLGIGNFSPYPRRA
ncbi:hypothetical protein [Amycolatopsis orientalis]|uniref:hypothetical protein n=1 Tax=Amycolatopsis orientalis TaxID=31958 RepID=UPI0011AB5578|nr:hypothetical protein [Amycolatopsis orientalis]